MSENIKAFIYHGLLEYREFGEIEALFLDTDIPLIAHIRNRLEKEKYDIEIIISVVGSAGSKKAKGKPVIDFMAVYRQSSDRIEQQATFKVGDKDINTLLENLVGHIVNIDLKILGA